MARVPTIILAALLWPSLACAGQVPQPATKPAAAPTPPAIADPLGRETPRGTVVGFLRAAQDENYSVAAQYFQALPGHRAANPIGEQDLAAQLLAAWLCELLPGPLQQCGGLGARAWTHEQQPRVSTLPATREAKAGRAILEDRSRACW